MTGNLANQLHAGQPSALAAVSAHPFHLPGGGELGQLIRTHDWASTPLGPMEQWPQSLRTTVSVVLYSAFPTIVLWGPDLVQVYNDGYRLLMGAKHPTGLGQPTRECWPEAWHINETIYPRVRAGETVSFEEARYPLAPNGVLEDYFLTLSYSPVFDETGGVGGILVTVFDVTEEVRTRQERDRALAESRAGRARLVEVFMQAPAAIAVLEGPRHHFTVANPRYLELVGGREVVGKDLLEALPELRDQGFDRLLDQVRETAQPYLASEAVVRLDRRRDGTLEDVYLDFVYQPLEDADGTVFGVMAHAVDVTEQRQLRHRVEHERNRLRDVFREAPAAIAVTEGPAHTFVTANGMFRRLVRVDRPLDGLPIREALPELGGQGFFEILDEVFATGRQYVGSELRARFDRDGSGTVSEGYFNFVYQPVPDEHGGVRGIMIHAVDVTEQVVSRRDVEHKAAELVRLTRDLAQSNRELDQFAYVASHDLKAPLRGIANLTQWIEEDAGPQLSGESREHMRLLQGRVHRMEALIDGILTYSRAGRVRAAPERVDTGALLREVIDLLDPGPGVDIDVPDDMPSLEAERVPMQQVFLNLLGNAVKYTKAERDDVRVSVRWRPVRDAFEFSVTDNGPGIAPEFHERVWGIFQTLQPRDKVEGTGIGLSVVRKIVQSRGGDVWIESGEGQGATFRFTWPRAPRPVPPSSSPDAT